jgi:hypothetical protein
MAHRSRNKDAPGTCAIPAAQGALGPPSCLRPFNLIFHFQHVLPTPASTIARTAPLHFINRLWLCLLADVSTL